MEDNNKKDGMGNCSCNCMGCKAHGMMGGNMCCGMGNWGSWGGNHHVSLFRIILFLLILGFIFSFGVKFGELKASIEGQHGGGYRMIRDYGAVGNYGPGMMYPLQGTVTQPSATLAK